MKNFKTIASVILVMMVFFSFTANSASATIDKPSSSWNLSTKGRYNFDGEAANSTLYSNYNFTGVSKMRIKATNYNSSQDLVVKLYEEGAWLVYIDFLGYSTKRWFNNLDS